MPEGPEIRFAADQLNAVLSGRTIERAEFTLPGMERAARQIKGCQVTRVTSHGKAMLTHFNHGETLYSHNQLYGLWRVTKAGHYPKTNRQLRVGLHTKTHSALLYSATAIELWPTDHLDDHPFLRKLGPDVLDEHLTPAHIASRLSDKAFKKRSLATLFLDQRFLAGVGNYLRSEILFKARLPPTALPINLPLPATRRLARATLSTTQRSYRTRGLTISNAMARTLAEKEEASLTPRFAVFGRKGRKCINCSSLIKKDLFCARRLYWCPNCQTL